MIIKAKPEHEVIYQELAELMRKHAKEVTSLEILAIASNMVGKIIAMQDQRTCSKEVIMEIVSGNIENGNQQLIDDLTNRTEGHA